MYDIKHSTEHVTKPSTTVYILVAHVQSGHNMSIIHYVRGHSILDSCEH
jgi:hypothetical protein